MSKSKRYPRREPEPPAAPPAPDWAETAALLWLLAVLVAYLRQLLDAWRQPFF